MAIETAPPAISGADTATAALTGPGIFSRLLGLTLTVVPS
jgi:hypothetical protein